MDLKTGLIEVFTYIQEVTVLPLIDVQASDRAVKYVNLCNEIQGCEWAVIFF